MKLKLVMFLSVMAFSTLAQAKSAGVQCWCANSGPGTFVIAPNMPTQIQSITILSSMGGGNSCACRDAGTGIVTSIGSVTPGGGVGDQ